ncbi:MAG: hypothetical protein DI630_16620 [Gordonia sp. (in: high G+C Gram-positive bacteria)]|nr:MAG: hypothetical protein DI630_16620 [Gordonia sp. (in: high G+C Gram-positive bacteria)]
MLQSSGEPLASVIRMVSDALMRYGIETDHRAVVARCDQPAPYRDLITGETGGLSSDYRDSFAAANRVLDGQPIQQTRDDLRASLDTTDEIDTEGIELQPELAAKAIVSAMVHWHTDVPRKLSAQVAAMIGRHVVYRDALLRTAAYDTRAAAAVFTELARPLRGANRANVLALAAACHYLGGNGVMVGVTLDHIAEDTELPRFAQLLDQAIRAGIRPEQLADLIRTAEAVNELFGGHFPTYRT